MVCIDLQIAYRLKIGECRVKFDCSQRRRENTRRVRGEIHRQGLLNVSACIPPRLCEKLFLLCHLFQFRCKVPQGRGLIGDAHALHGLSFGKYLQDHLSDIVDVTLCVDAARYS